MHNNFLVDHKLLIVKIVGTFISITKTTKRIMYKSDFLQIQQVAHFWKCEMHHPYENDLTMVMLYQNEGQF